MGKHTSLAAISDDIAQKADPATTGSTLTRGQWEHCGLADLMLVDLLTVFLDGILNCHFSIPQQKEK